MTCHIKMIDGQTMLILKDADGRMVDAIAVDNVIIESLPEGAGE